MTYIICVFTSRRDAMALYDYCLRRRIEAAIVNTPREASASCGISVRIEYRYRYDAIQAAATLRSYVAAYQVRETGTHRNISKI